jgi:hypothetical protein
MSAFWHCDKILEVNNLKGGNIWLMTLEVKPTGHHHMATGNQKQTEKKSWWSGSRYRP